MGPAVVHSASRVDSAWEAAYKDSLVVPASEQRPTCSTRSARASPPQQSGCRTPAQCAAGASNSWRPANTTSPAGWRSFIG
jgi:hypothetical protein